MQCVVDCGKSIRTRSQYLSTIRPNSLKHPKHRHKDCIDEYEDTEDFYVHADVYYAEDGIDEPLTSQLPLLTLADYTHSNDLVSSDRTKRYDRLRYNTLLFVLFVDSIYEVWHPFAQDLFMSAYLQFGHYLIAY